jgi:hypothetical protein
VDVRVKTHGVAPVHSVKLLMGFDYTLEVDHRESPRMRAWSCGRLAYKTDGRNDQFGRRTA